MADSWWTRWYLIQAGKAQSAWEPQDLRPLPVRRTRRNRGSHNTRHKAIGIIIIIAWQAVESMAQMTLRMASTHASRGHTSRAHQPLPKLLSSPTFLPSQARSCPADPQPTFGDASVSQTSACGSAYKSLNARRTVRWSC
jgi:hypothetical protein